MPIKGQVKYQVNIGDRFGRLTVMERSSRPSVSSMYFLCRCDCGTQKDVRKDSLYTKRIVSCGCYQREVLKQANTTHGQRAQRTAEYDCWAHMLRRCHTPTTRGYHNYGGRGIAVCDRWRNSFENFFADMGRRPSPKHSLDRIDVNGNYEASNCRWADLKTQCNNRRNNVFLEFNGERLTVSQWAAKLGFGREVIRRRLQSKWPVEEILTVPVGQARHIRNRSVDELP